MSDQLDALFNQARDTGAPASAGDPLDATWDKPAAANDADPLDAAWHDDAATKAGVSLTIKRDANPDRAGEANVLARDTGLPGDTAENELDTIKAARRLSDNAALARGNPKLAQWVSNPRNAAVAVDDMGVLGRVGKGVTDFLAPYARGAKAVGGATYAGLWDINQGIYGLGEFLTTPMFGADSTSVSTFFAGKRREAANFGNAAQPQTGNFVTDSLLTGLRSLPTTAAAVGLSMAGAPSAGLALFGGVQGGQSFGQARDAGKSPAKAAAFGAVQGAIEAGTEALPMKFLVGSLGKVGLPHFLAGFFGREVGSEEVSTLAQNAEQWANLNPDKSFSDFVKEQPAAMAQTALGTLAIGGSAGILHIAASAHNAQQNRVTAEAATAGVDNIMLNAAVSKVRVRDPSAFHEFVASHTENTPVENMYIPGEKVRAFLQSDRFDPSDEGHQWLSGLSDQANEAAALGGDVVIPVADAATHLAGTKAWDAIKADVRVNPGGLSETEAKTAEDHFHADIESRVAELERQAANDVVAAAPPQHVYEDVRDRLMHAGQSPDVADKLAQLYAAHATAVGAQLGTDAAAYHAANPVEFRQVLPPALARVQAVDGLDMVINALKRGAEKQTDAQKFGPSLLDFIAKRGGIEDKGGDLAAMGAANWHKEKPFRKRLLKAAGADQSLPGITKGETPNSPDSPDSLALTAWEAGYFPEHGERPHVNDLLAAIDDELRGKPRFAADSVTEQQQLADAADELRGILEQRGIDPEKTTRESIRQELQRYSQEQTGGRSLEQGQLIGDLPKSGVVPANVGEDGKVYVGKPGDLHFSLTERYPDVAWTGETGFVSPEGKYLTRDQALDWVNSHGFKVKPSANMEGQLDAADYREQAARRSLDQSYGEGVRGRATFGTGKPIIEMFAAADLSTMIHETGHVWLEELKANADNVGLAADWQTVKDWFAANGHAVGADGIIPTEAHELWARGFERFTMEGKAPSSALRRAFDAFRAWLLHIYKVVDNLKAPITPEIRNVMNRMLATQEEIDAAEQLQNLKALFTDAAQAGMTEEEFAAYQAAAGEARGEAYDALIYRTMATVRAARTKEWKAEEATVRADVTARINQRPEFKALHLLRTGKWLGEPERDGVKVKLDRQWLVDSYGADALSMLPKGVPPIYGEKGTDADAIAEMVGFGTGDEMVRHLMGIEAAQKDLREAGDKRSVRQSLIDQETTAEMRDRHGDPLNDGSIEEEALAAVHNDRQGELIASEARALTRRTGGAPTPYKLAREWAARKVAEGKVVDVASRSALWRYAKAAAKAGKAAEAAILKGDVDETFRQKQAQLLNHALLVEAKKAADDVDAAVTRLSKIARRATMKSVDQDYLDRAHALLEQFDLRPASQKGLDEREGFSAWAAAQRANGVDIVTPPRLEARGEHYSRISVEELRGLKDSVDQLIHLGRLKQKLTDAKEQRDFDEVVDEAVNSTGQLPPRTPSDNMTPSGWERFKTRIASADAALLKMETIIDRLDNGNPNGVFNRLVFRPLADAQARSRAMMAEKIGEHQALLKLVPKEQLKRWSQRVVVPELINKETGRPFNMTRDRLIQIALNMGNEGNADKLARGYGWDEATVMRVLDRELTKEEWQHVQAELDLVGSLWPQIAAMYKRLNGVEPEKVDARPIETRHGTFAGGYFPVIYDSTKDTTAEAQSAAAGDQLFENIYTRATTANGFTEKRTNVARPINLAYGLTSRHLAEVIHDLTHREAVINADKFLSDKRIVKAVRSTMGPEVQKQFRPWLQHVANEMALDKRGLAGWEAFAKKLRTNTSIMGMGYRLSVILTQIVGYTNSAEQIGTRWMASGFKQASNPKNWGAVIERSAEVRMRLETLDRDIQDNIKALVGDHSSIANVKRFAFTGIGWMDRVVVIPTWLGAFEKAQSEGMTDDDAIYYADKIVRNSQGANAAKDLAAVQRGHEFWKLATMFYSYASAFVNRQHSIAWDTGDAVRERNIAAAPSLMARSFWLFAAAPLMQALITGHGPGEDDDWGSWAFWNMFSNFFMGVPIMRDVTGALSSGYGYSYTPVERMIGTVFKVAKDVKHIAQGDEAPQAPRHLVEATGYAAGLPLGQLASATQFALDVSKGDQDPETAGEWYRGITTGRAQKQPTFR